MPSVPVNASPFSLAAAPCAVDKNEIGLNTQAQSKGGLLALIKRYKNRIVVDNFSRYNPQPFRSRIETVSNACGCSGVLQFRINDRRNEDGFEETRQKIEMADFRQITNRGGIGDDDMHLVAELL